MGSSKSKKCTPANVFDARRNSNYYELGGVGSFSNPSLVTVTSVETNMVEISPSQQFTEEHITEIYEQYKLENGLKNNISYNIVRIVSTIIETLSMDDHILFIANKFFERVYLEDSHYMNLFNNSLAKNEITQFENKNLLLEHHMILHIMFTLKLHKFVLTTFDDGKDDKAYEILSLVALSHMIMKVERDSFKYSISKIMQAVIHFNLITEEQVPPFVYYLRTVVNHITMMIGKYTARNVHLYETLVDYNSPARENYRELKKWKMIIANLKKSLLKPIIQLEKQIEEDKKKVNVGNVEDEEELWKIIRLLKKGYKYKNKKPKDKALLLQP